MTPRAVFNKIRDHIARDEMPAALNLLRALLENTPQLNDVLQQSGRLENIRRDMRLGTVSRDEAALEQNRIRFGVLELLSQIERDGSPPATLRELLAVVEQESARPALRKEVEQAISIVNSKNVVVNSTITAGGDVQFGDKTIHTESQTSKRLRLFLHLFVPMLAIGGAWFWHQSEKMKTPLSLTVEVDYRPPNADLNFEGGTVRLKYCDDTRNVSIAQSVDFKGIPPGCKTINLHFEASGFAPMDTTVTLPVERLTLPIRRDNSLARVFGTVRDGQGRAVEGVTIRVQGLTTQTLPDGSFSLPVPTEKQRKKQRVEVLKNGKVVWDYTQPVMTDAGIEIKINIPAKGGNADKIR